LIIVSRTETLRQVIGRWGVTIPAAMRPLIEGLDQKKTSASAQLGPPLGRFRFLDLSGRETLSQVQNTVDEAEIGAAADLSRVMQLPDETAAAHLAADITAGFEQAMAKVKFRRQAGPVLEAVKIVQVGRQVRLSLHLSKPIADEEALGIVNDLFSS